MIATLERIKHTDVCTLGKLTIAGETFYTVERPWLNNQRMVSCVPEGTYLVRRDQEGKYTGYWELQNVPGRSEIIIHEGNTAQNVVGCIAVGLGLVYPENRVTQSKAAIKYLHELTCKVDEFTLRIFKR